MQGQIVILSFMPQVVPYKLDGELRDNGVRYDMHNKNLIQFIEDGGHWGLHVSRRKFELANTIQAYGEDDVKYPMCLSFHEGNRGLQLIRLMNVPDNVKEAMKVAGRARNVDGKWMHPAKAPGEWRPSSGCNEAAQW